MSWRVGSVWAGVWMRVVSSPSGTGSFCAGGTGLTIGLSGSQSGVNYQLKLGGVNIGSALPGTGSALSWANNTSAGTYTISATNATTGCLNTMTGSATITVNPLPSTFTVGGTGSFCSGGVGLPITLSGSVTGTNYQLKIGSTNVGATVAGTGAALTWPNQTTGGAYTIVATIVSTSCSATMTGSAVITVNPLPAAATVSGGGGYCAGGTGVTINLSASVTGINYQLKNGASNVGTPVAGTGSPLNWASQMAAGIYTVVATDATSGCTNTMTSSATVTINPLPVSYSVTGGTVCAPGSITVGLSGSQTGVNYQLKLNGVNSGAVSAGTNSALSWGAQSTAGTYAIVAANATTLCTQTMTGSAIINPQPLSTFTMSGGVPICAGSPGTSISLSGSEAGVNYQLKIDGVNSGTPLAGNGSVLNWNNQATAGTYSVTATNAATTCATAMASTTIVSINPLPLSFAVSGGGAICAGGVGTTVTLSGSQTGVNYQLQQNGLSSGGALAGTGSGMSWSSLTSAGVYAVVAVNAGTGCTATMNGSATVTVNPLPALYTMQVSSTSFCPNSGGVSVNVNGSETGVNYQLQVDGAIAGAALAGTGSMLTWPNQTSAGTYTVVATVALTGCTQAMTGTAVVSVSGLPIQYAMSGGGAYPGTGPGLTVTLSSSQAGASYQLQINGVPTGAAVQGTGNPLNWLDQKTVGTYTIQATGNTTTCTQAMTGNAVVTIDPVWSSLDHWAFLYKYDGRNRMIQKKVPGADWTYMVYDLRDRLVMTQDGNQRLANQWSFTKYDALNRPVMTGIYTHGSPLDQGGMTDLISTTNFFETYNGTSSTHGYTNNVFPNSSTNVLTTTYYDDYSFKSMVSGYDYVSSDITGQPGAEFSRVMGHPTGTKVNILGTAAFLWSVSYYDDKYRFIQTTATNHVGGTDRVTNLLDFVGRVLKTKTTHSSSTLKWKDVHYVHITPNSARSFISGQGAGLASGQLLAANTDGWLEFTIRQISTTQYVGLSLTNTDDSPSSINYAFLTSWTSLWAYENGVPKGAGQSVAIGDVLRIDRTGSTIRYYKNGTLFYTSLAPTTSTLLVDISLDSFGSVEDLRASFSWNQTHTALRRYDYDHASRIINVWHSLDANPEVLLVKNEYNELGQLVDKKLHSTDNGSTFKQSVDYRYNIRGWLKSMNNSQLANDGSLTNDETNDLFGMELGYDIALGTSNAPLYNGNISAMKWSQNLALGTVKDVGYNYTYDPLNRITGAAYLSNTAGVWANATNAFNESGYTYDLNGNITALTRKAAAGASMDILAYDYGNLGNQLLKVSDTGDKTKGFIEPTSTTGNDYLYDANGNMTSDQNKGIGAITYNYMNLPVQVTKSDNKYVNYVYDASGRKLAQHVYATASSLQKVTDYSGEYISQNDTLQFVNHEEGRIVMTGATPEYQYHLKDHLGNVRTTFTTKQVNDTYAATFEDNTRTTEQSQFNHYSRVTNDLYDHTDAGTVYDKVQLLNGGYNSQVGLAKSLAVMPGDTVRADVFAKYFGTTGTSGNLAGFAAALLSAFGLPNPPVGEVGTVSSALNNYGGLIAAGGNPGNPAWPKGWLNVLMFDKDYNLVDLAYQQLDGAYVQSGSTKAPHQLLSRTVQIKQAGYVFIYVSNEGAMQQDVYFDDFKVTHVKSPVIETNDYYSGGAMFNTYTRENSLLNRFKYQHKEFQDDLGINLYDFHWRQYDPWILRTTTMDPESEKFYPWSPYSWEMGDPVKNVDHDGRIVGTLIGTVVGAVAGAIDAHVNGKDVWAGAAEGAVAGAIAGAIVDLTVATGGGAAVVIGAAAAGGALGGAAGDVVGQVVTSVNKGDKLSTAASNVNFDNTAKKALSGAATGLIGGAAGAGVGKALGAVTNSTKAVQAVMGKNIVQTAKTLTQMGASTQTTGKAVDKIVQGMGIVGKNTANAVAKTEAAATMITEGAIKTGEAATQKKPNQ